MDEIGDIINDWYWWWHDLDDISDEIDDIIDDIWWYLGEIWYEIDDIWVIFGWYLDDIWDEIDDLYVCSYMRVYIYRGYSDSYILMIFGW